jgi:hypothetical protein
MQPKQKQGDIFGFYFFDPIDMTEYYHNITAGTKLLFR